MFWLIKINFFILKFLFKFNGKFIWIFCDVLLIVKLRRRSKLLFFLKILKITFHPYRSSLSFHPYLFILISFILILISSSLSLHPYLFILISSSLSLHPYLFILISSSLSLHPYLFILISSSLSLHPYLFIIFLVIILAINSLDKCINSWDDTSFHNDSLSFSITYLV